MLSKTSLFLAICFSFRAYSQTISPLEPVSEHYKELQQLDSASNTSRADLDDIRFPMSEANARTLSYVEMSPHYLSKEQVNQLKHSIKPPANSSDQTKAEIDYLLKWQEKRTSEEINRATQVLAPIGYWPHADSPSHWRYEENLEHLFYVGRSVLGDACNADNYPATRKLFAGITKDMRIMEFSAKYHLLRARPYHLSSELQPLARIGSPSFASGHTLWAYIHAFAWSELVPSKRSDFIAVAYEVGESREIMGIHYPSDEEAARVLAHRMLTSMLDNPDFVEDLKAAKEECE